MAEVTNEVIASYNAIAAEYDRLFGRDTSNFHLLENFRSLLAPNSRVLDVGCGSGGVTRYFVNNGFKTEGVDLSESMLQIARRRLPSVTFHLMDMLNLANLNRTYDGVCFSYSLFHLRKCDIAKTLSVASEILTPTGALLVVLQEGEGEQWVDEPLDHSRRMYLSLYSEAEARDLLERAGFTVVCVQHRDPAPEGDNPFRKMFFTCTKSAARN